MKKCSNKTIIQFVLFFGFFKTLILNFMIFLYHRRIPKKESKISPSLYYVSEWMCNVCINTNHDNHHLSKINRKQQNIHTEQSFGLPIVNITEFCLLRTPLLSLHLLSISACVIVWCVCILYMCLRSVQYGIHVVVVSTDQSNHNGHIPKGTKKSAQNVQTWALILYLQFLIASNIFNIR